VDLTWYLLLAGACPEAVSATRRLSPKAAWNGANRGWRNWATDCGEGYGNGYGYGYGDGYGDGSGYGYGSGEGEGEGGGYGYGSGNGSGNGNGYADIDVWDGRQWVGHEGAKAWIAEQAAKMEQDK
jgi:hypothetical protein